MFNESRKNFKLGLVGFLSLCLAGCATPIGYRYKTETIENIKAYDEKKVTTREENRGALLIYKINEIKTDRPTLNFSVKESKKEISDIITTTSIPIYKEEIQIREGRAYTMTLVGPSNPFQTSYEVISNNRVKVRDDISEKKEKKEEIIYENQPARDLLVKVNSQYFGFGENKASSILTRTDANGIAKAQITKKPSLWYSDEKEAQKDILPVLKKGIKQSLLDKINLNDIQLRIINKQYSINIKTMSEASLALNPEENLKFKDDEKTFSVAGKEIDVSSLYSYIENVIKTDLESIYMPHSVVIRAVGEDLCPIDAVVDFNPVKTLSLEELLNEIQRIKENYLVKDSELFEKVYIDPSYLISNLSGQTAEIPAEGLQIMINVPSKYKIRVKKEGYVPAEGEVEFTEKNLRDVEVKMGKLATNVNIGTSRSSINRK